VSRRDNLTKNRAGSMLYSDLDPHLLLEVEYIRFPCLVANYFVKRAYAFDFLSFQKSESSYSGITNSNHPKLIH